MEGLENHKQLVCTNHGFVHKPEVDSPPGPSRFPVHTIVTPHGFLNGLIV